MRIIILGGGGFIGSHLCNALEELTGIQYVVIDKDFSRFEEGDPILGDCVGMDLMNMKKSEIEWLENQIKGSNFVIDLVAHANPSMYMADPIGVVDLNYNVNLKIASMCLKQGVHLIQFSSCEVYGMTPQHVAGIKQDIPSIMSEDASPCIYGPVKETRWIYACAKQLLERMVVAMGEHGLKYTIIRPFNFYGPDMDFLPSLRPDIKTKPRVIPCMVDDALMGRPIRVIGDGSQMRSFTHISDAISAILLILRNFDKCTGEIINVGPDAGNSECSMTSLALTIGMILSKSGKAEPEIQSITGDDFYASTGYGDCDRRIANNSKLRALGWQPHVKLSSGLDQTIQTYVEQWEQAQVK